MEPIPLSRRKQDHIVWTDLVFRIPPQRPQAKVLETEAKSHISAAGTSSIQPRGSCCQQSKRDQRMKPRYRCLDHVQDKQAEDAGEPSLPSSHATNPLPPSGSLALPEKYKVKKILVDLRSVLENVMGPSEEESREEDLQNDACSSPDLGDSSSEALVPSEKAEEKDPTSDEHPPSNARDPSSEEHGMGTATDSEDGQANRDVSLPPSADAGREFNLGASRRGPLKGSRSPPSVTMPARRDKLPAVPPPPSHPTTSLWCPKVVLQQRSLPEADSTSQPVRASPPSPDFQLPTQLLLQRLQETTTSKNHLLIMQVLRSLREELLAPDSGDRDKWDCPPEPPTENPEKLWKPQTRTRKPAAPNRGLGKWMRCAKPGQKTPDL